MSKVGLHVCEQKEMQQVPPIKSCRRRPWHRRVSEAAPTTKDKVRYYLCYTNCRNLLERCLCQSIACNADRSHTAHTSMRRRSPSQDAQMSILLEGSCQSVRYLTQLHAKVQLIICMHSVHNIAKDQYQVARDVTLRSC